MKNGSFLVALSLTMSAFAANVTGSIKFEGAAPARKPLDMKADPKCAAANKTKALSEKVIVNSNKTLKNAFVYIKEGKTPAPAATQKVVFDQKNCTYTPHVFGIQVGQTLEIINSDETLHNVHAMPKVNPQFNQGMPKKDMKITKTFSKPEIGAKIKCDVHPWMSAFANVVENSYFAVSDDNGKFNISGVPAGSYTVAVWHEELGTKEAKLTVTDKDATVDFSFAGK